MTSGRQLTISEHFPPHVREALVRAAAAGNLEEIDRITDLASISYPDLVVPRNKYRSQFAPLARDTKQTDGRERR